MYDNGALSGMVVLDLTRILAGPYCSMMFADMGANVIKIEHPKVGDDSRGLYPVKNGESYYYMNLNRNKRSFTLNLKSPEGKKVFLDLVKKQTWSWKTTVPVFLTSSATATKLARP